MVPHAALFEAPCLSTSAMAGSILRSDLILFQAGILFDYSFMSHVHFGGDLAQCLVLLLQPLEQFVGVVTPDHAIQ